MRSTRSILVPLDLSDPSAETIGIAHDLAESLDADLHILHVAGVGMLSPALDLATASVGASPFPIDHVQQAAAAHVNRFIYEHCPDSNCRVTINIVTGGVVPEVLRYAAHYDIDLIVMGSRAHGLFNRLVRGSISESVLERANFPILLVPHRAA